MNFAAKSVPVTNTWNAMTILWKKNGFIYPSYEIYGGVSGLYDYGPLGQLMKQKLLNQFWRHSVYNTDERIYPLDTSILTPKIVLTASGHLSNFADTVVDCSLSNEKVRTDSLRNVIFEKLTEESIKIRIENIPEANAAEWKAKIIALINDDQVKVEENTIRNTIDVTFPIAYREQLENSKAHPQYNSIWLGNERKMNLMYSTFNDLLLRPETTHGIITNFSNVVKSMSAKLPFGIMQIGKSFRNEINAYNLLFRLKEFEQVELEYFVKPRDEEMEFKSMVEKRLKFWKDLSYNSDKFTLNEKSPDDLAHYCTACTDIEYEFPFGIGEIEGIANRRDFDFLCHEKATNSKLRYFCDKEGEIIPSVIESSAGVGRGLMSLLCEAYTVDHSMKDSKGKPKERLYFKIDPRIAPYTLAVLPIVKKEEFSQIANDITKAIYEQENQNINCIVLHENTIGKRYAVQDERGTPFCATIDDESLVNGTCTLRDRNTAKQKRVPISQVASIISDLVKGKLTFEDLNMK